MKKLFTYLFFVTCCATMVANAQPTPPPDSKTPFSKGHTLINNYETMVAKHKPNSFLCPADDVTEYLRGMGGSYLHVYFASWDVAGKDVFLVMVRTSYSGGRASHDNTVNSNKVICTSKSDVGCCTEHDDLDGPDVLKVPLCQIENCHSLVLRKAGVKQYIKYYQQSHPQGTGPGYSNTQSFVIDAKSLRDYLVSSNAEYLQIYLGYDLALPAKDHLTMVMAGVNRRGNHDYNHQTGPARMVYDEVKPCPICSIDMDADMDFEKQ